ncbi:NACHT, LRR and PYD domains-containing protein 10-like 7 [Homarus americanus]|uniref:NACHT, LRR and PYD domains-containing protein 10-like 7 n=1 Tax=Homarus americanus TaxID=6706 RepID=A0A8J5K8L5_HOMAM|nr:NACHT, LRR and PYD domains-containing protein 10-like 7 [Homarus americanus]
MVGLSMDTVGLRQAISQALKTTARDTLALLYQKLFSENYPGKTPYEVVSADKGASAYLNQNFSLKKKIKANIPGNIENLRKIRNEDAHWTKEGCPDKNLEDTWQQLAEALTNILQLAGLESHLPRVKQELGDIRNPKQETSSDIKLLQESLQNELKELYRSGRKTTLMPIVWGGRSFSFHHHVNKTYTKTRLTVLHDGLEKEIDSEELLENFGSSRIIILEGESGTGKTSLLRHFADAWEAKTPTNNLALSYVDYLIFLDCTAVTTKTFTLPDIIQEVMPNACSRSRPSAILNELSKAEDKVMFLIDAFDERLKAFVNAFKNLQRTCSKAFFVVTTRPHCTQAITALCQKPIVVTTHGFCRRSALAYATKLFKVSGSEKVQEFFSVMSSYDELITIPQLLCWCSWFWIEKEAENFTARGKIFASITDFLLRKLCHINGKRIIAGELPSEGQRWLSKVARLAYTEAKHNYPLLSESSSEIKKLSIYAQQLKLRPLEALSTLMQCDSSMTGMGEHNVFQFAHESHANFLAAYHITEKLQSNKKVKLSNILKDLQMNRQKSIMKFLVSLLFEKKERVDTRIIQDIAKISKRYVNFYDINFFLELLEESSYSKDLAKALAKQIPGDSHGASPSHTTTERSISPPQFNNQLWLRPKELRHNEALLLLLSQAQPMRLWLRLSEGPHVDEDNPVRGHQAVGGDAAAALKLVSKAYRQCVLADLRLTDVAISTSLSWPKSLWWLSLERCNIKTRLALPPGLLKLRLTECTGLGNIIFPVNLKSLELQNIDLKKNYFPISVETLVLNTCTINNLPCFPPGIKSLKLIQCSIIGELNFPHTLEHVKVSATSKDLQEGTQSLKLIHYSEQLMLKLKGPTTDLEHLRSLTITNVALTPEAFLDYFFDFEEKNPRSRLMVDSMCALKDKSNERDIIVSSVLTSSLPNVTVKFGKDVFTN